MRFFRWIRYWYRRLRYGPFNEVTIPRVNAPWPTIDVKKLVETQPMVKR